MELKGALTGARYLASLKDEREVWLDGERVDVTAHAAFGGMRDELAHLYDQQHQSATQDIMTFVSSESGKRLSYSHLLPRTPNDLLKRRCVPMRPVAAGRPPIRKSLKARRSFVLSGARDRRPSARSGPAIAPERSAHCSATCCSVLKRPFRLESGPDFGLPVLTQSFIHKSLDDLSALGVL
jgi:hypothetical protein